MKEERKKRLTPEQIQQIIEAASPNLTINQIAAKVELSRTQVLPVLNRRKIVYKYEWIRRDDEHKRVSASWLSDEQKETIRYLSAPTKAPSEIAKVVKSSPQRVRDYLESVGLPFKQQIAGSRKKVDFTPEVFTWEWAEEVDHLFKRA